MTHSRSKHISVEIIMVIFFVFETMNGWASADCAHPACRVYFPLHPARYEPVSTHLGPHSRRTHVPLVRHPPSLDIKANRNAPAIRRHSLAWEHQAKWQYTKALRELGQRCSNAVTAAMIMAQRWGTTVSLPSAKCYLYSLSHNYKVCTTGLYSQISPPLITNE